ncbi:hypothetical protein D3C80_1782070 [compost metagenome]
MGIDKARHYQFVLIMSDLKPRWQQQFPLLPGAKPDNAAFIEQQQSVRNMSQLLIQLLRLIDTGSNIEKIATDRRGE